MPTDPNPATASALSQVKPTAPAVHELMIQTLKNPHLIGDQKRELIELLHQIVHTDQTRAHLTAALKSKTSAADYSTCRNIDAMQPSMNIEHFSLLMEEISEKLVETKK